ncbi:8-oxo-dGTP pyrophosphatase MutT, NUDIX family [Cnuella takakiae]|uniref:GDP-mannose pyrophosphatase n=1 Tax=Cnuella takakiae TaxID=1302690 RepID=A0A1M5HK87_9BACT|nr:NUDIX hydrolase [Cnuella takakiae]OLY92902.1 DNA mismatch repair protein MutT [Cnuella takakiae]SHG16383.1 8-oxo-dGTP pyrophosphatase MutT, NUDIX family [Cnuella takakiae]
MKWKVLDSTYLFREPWLTVRKDKCEMANGHVMEAFYVNEYPDWVNVFALTDEGKVIMVKQYRHGAGAESIELPGGVAEKGEEMMEACKRELMEETGYACTDWEYLGKISANPSTTNNYMHMFLARNGKKVAPQNLDAEEELEVMELTIEEIKELVYGHKLLQSLHTNNIFYALHRLGKLC